MWSFKITLNLTSNSETNTKVRNERFNHLSFSILLHERALYPNPFQRLRTVICASLSTPQELRSAWSMNEPIYGLIRSINMDKLGTSTQRICMLAACRRRHLRVSSYFPFLFDNVRICWFVVQESRISGNAYRLTNIAESEDVVTRILAEVLGEWNTQVAIVDNSVRML